MMTEAAEAPNGHQLSQDQIFVRAVRIATNAHRGQVGHDGRPYIEHCERVAMRVDPSLRPIAYLHDVVEKSEGWSIERLGRDGFPAAVLEAVDALTRRAGEEEEAYLRRVAGNPLAITVKRADLEDNLSRALARGEDAAVYRERLSRFTDILASL
jgi:(p)ppGpp synthase/HD superfamily hydrolase